MKKFSTISVRKIASDIPLIATHVAEKSLLKKAMLTGKTRAWKKRMMTNVISQKNLQNKEYIFNFPTIALLTLQNLS